MEGVIDWIGLSVDSPDESDEMEIGRHGKDVNHIFNIIKVAEIAHRHGIKVKLNITVVKKSWTKDFRQLIECINPERTKVFRALTIKNANDDIPDTWSITDEQFIDFKRRHENIRRIVFEDNDNMTGSYLMFDPMGRWMVNNDGEKRFLPLDYLVENGPETNVSVQKYHDRGGEYDW